MRKSGYFEPFAGILCLFSLITPFAFGAYLESDPGTSRPMPIDPPPRIIRPPVPAPDPGNPLIDLVRRVDVGRPVSYRNITVFPLTLRASWDSDIRTLDEALSRRWISIREKDSAQVPEILVRNDSRREVFLMAGEIVSGGRQNRVIRDDVLLPSMSEFTAIPVYCVEKERWSGKDETFASPQIMADPGLRKMAAGAAEQGEIWREIDKKLETAKVPARTRGYYELYDDKTTRKDIGKAVDELKAACRRDTVGAVMVSGERIVSCDLFSDSALFSRLWDKICRSYAVDTLGWGERDRRIDIDRDDIRRFLDRVGTARFTSEDTPGRGRRLRISGDVDGNALLSGDRVVHAVIFQGRGYPVPMLRRNPVE